MTIKLTNKQTNRLSDCLSVWLTDWLTDCMTFDWLTDCLTLFLLFCLSSCLSDSLPMRLPDWLQHTVASDFILYNIVSCSILVHISYIFPYTHSFRPLQHQACFIWSIHLETDMINARSYYNYLIISSFVMVLHFKPACSHLLPSFGSSPTIFEQKGTACSPRICIWLVLSCYVRKKILLILVILLTPIHQDKKMAYTTPSGPLQ